MNLTPFPENDDQHRFLEGIGCGEAQGYLYAHPLEPAAIERLLRAASQAMRG